MKPIPLPSKAVLDKYLTYNPDTGKIYWKERSPSDFKTEKLCDRWNNLHAGTEAFTSLDGEGYLYGRFQGKFYKAARIAWKMLYNEDPIEIDHDNRIRTDNRKVNLVAATPSSNSKNRSKRSDNTSGFTGVHHLKTGKWQARIGRKHLGTFSTMEAAIEARKQALADSDYHVNHGKEMLNARQDTGGASQP